MRADIKGGAHGRRPFRLCAYFLIALVQFTSTVTTRVSGLSGPSVTMKRDPSRVPALSASGAG